MVLYILQKKDLVPIYQVHFSTTMLRVIFTDTRGIASHVNHVTKLKRGFEIVFTKGDPVTFDFADVVVRNITQEIDTHDAFKTIETATSYYATRRTHFDVEE